ncbi:hypothetical protein BpHYR1_014050 [Brachionus plicatilis]|uniref:Uncharacterized protein n=1 Tax=Brachionus plicatilis TaxID=10195 RepID=A0A3M7T6P8_BRAPC|nr:hypothetical protein BpHYR1_014050 [Brachionus plicatilis]
MFRIPLCTSIIKYFYSLLELFPASSERSFSCFNNVTLKFYDTRLTYSVPSERNFSHAGLKSNRLNNDIKDSLGISLLTFEAITYRIQCNFIVTKNMRISSCLAHSQLKHRQIFQIFDLNAKIRKP